MSSSRKLFAFQPKNRCQPSKKCVNRPKERDANKLTKQSEKKCHQVKKNVSSDRNNCVIWSKKCINQLKICFNQSKTCSSKSKKCVYRSKKYYQPVEKKVATERKQESANWTKKGIYTIKMKNSAWWAYFAQKIPIRSTKIFVDRMIRYFDPLTLRLDSISTRKHFYPKTLRLEGTQPTHRVITAISICTFYIYHFC